MRKSKCIFTNKESFLNNSADDVLTNILMDKEDSIIGYVTLKKDNLYGKVTKIGSLDDFNIYSAFPGMKYIGFIPVIDETGEEKYLIYVKNVSSQIFWCSFWATAVVLGINKILDMFFSIDILGNIFK